MNSTISFAKMRWGGAVQLAVGFLLMVLSVQGADMPLDAQSTTGPKPPEALQESLFHSALKSDSMSVQVLLDNVPAYEWYRGCAPTVCTMLMGYYDNHGYNQLIAGSASNQNSAVNAAIASDEHYSDYSQPIDEYPNLIPDASQTNAAGCHADNSMADFLQTSVSAVDNYYGWTWFSQVDNALEGYVEWSSSDYTCQTDWDYWSNMSWSRLCGEIDSNRPAIFLVDSSGDGSSDHFVLVMGYGVENGTNMFACYNTWDQDVHWHEFTGMSEGHTWGIYGAVYAELGGAVQRPPEAAITPFPIQNALAVSTNVTLSWEDGGGALGYQVYLGTADQVRDLPQLTTTTNTQLSPGALSEAQTYCWRVDATNAVGVTTGTVWTFTTEGPVTHYVSPYGAHVAPFTSWANAATSVQAAVVAAVAEDKVLVTNGVYEIGSELVLNKNIKVVSVHGATYTVLDAGGDSRVVNLSVGSFSGFTLQGGVAGTNGGGALVSGGLLDRCQIQNCTAANGGGVSISGGGVVRSCLILNNSASQGGGVYFDNGGILQNATVVHNMGTTAGGGFYTTGNAQIFHSIIYFNTGGNWSEGSSGSPLLLADMTMPSMNNYTRCCLTPLPSMQTACTALDPLFEDAVGGDYRLSAESTLIDYGSSDDWMATALDLAGNPRMVNDAVDLGAYERPAYVPAEFELQVVSSYGMASPPTGVHVVTEFTVLTNSVNAEVTGSETQYVCTGWTMTGQAPLSGTQHQFVMTVTNDAVLQWNWQTNVLLTVSAEAHGQITGASSGWTQRMSVVELTAVPDVQYHFEGWAGDVPAGHELDNPLELLMDQALTVSAVFGYVVPAPTTFGLVDGELSSSWSANPGGLYQLQSCDDISRGIWFDCGTIITAQTDQVTLQDLDPPSGCRTYRAMRIMP